MADFTSYAVESAVAWLRRPQGEAWLQVQGLVDDAKVEAARRAVAQRILALCSADALPFHAFERSLERSPIESQEAWRERLDAAWETWPTAGTDPGLLGMLAVHGFTTAQIFWSRDIEPANPLWARFWLALPTVPWAFDGAWEDPGTWDDGGVWDTTASVDEIARLVRLIRTWKAAHARCMSVSFLIGDGGLWDAPLDTWDAGGVWSEGDVSYLFPEEYP